MEAVLERHDPGVDELGRPSSGIGERGRSEARALAAPYPTLTAKSGAMMGQPATKGIGNRDEELEKNKHWWKWERAEAAGDEGFPTRARIRW